MALVLPQHENEGRDKHVESGSIPRLDESSTLSSSTSNANNQCVAQITPGFTPKKVKPGVLFLYARNKPSNELEFHRLTPRLCLRGRPISSRNRSMRCLNHRTKSTPSRSSVKCSSVSFSWPKATDVFSAGNLRLNSSE